MKPAIRYRGRKPAHARDPLAVRPAERRAAAEPRIPLRIPRGLIVDLVERRKRYRRRYDAMERMHFATIEKAMPYLVRLLAEFPIAGELDVSATWAGWLALVEFAMRVKAFELARRVIPVLSKSKYHAEAEEQPTVDESALPIAAADFSAPDAAPDAGANCGVEAETTKSVTQTA